MNWIRELADKYMIEVHPNTYEQKINENGTFNGYAYASAFDALNIAHSNGINITKGLENRTLELITDNSRYALINLKKDDKKMEITVTLNDGQIMELLQNVNSLDYVDFMYMEDWAEQMDVSGMSALEILNSVNFESFDTNDKYVISEGLGQWISSNSLHEILEPYLDEMLQDYLDNNL